MDRKTFLQQCGVACLSAGALSMLLQGCTPYKAIDGTLEGSDLVLPLSAFQKSESDPSKFRKYLIVQHSMLQFPICVFRISENEYSALLMRCTHQGTELQVFGDRLQCPAHGSEFNKLGEVQQAPASTNLRSFPTTIAQDKLKISLQ